MTPREMGRARSFWLMGFSQRLASVQVSVGPLRRIREGAFIPKVVDGTLRS